MSMVDDDAIPACMKKAGFVDVRSRRFKLPATPWAMDQKMQQLGAFSRLAMEQDLDGKVFIMLTQNSSLHMITTPSVPPT